MNRIEGPFDKIAVRMWNFHNARSRADYARRMASMEAQEPRGVLQTCLGGCGNQTRALSGTCRKCTRGKK